MIRVDILGRIRVLSFEGGVGDLQETLAICKGDAHSKIPPSKVDFGGLLKVDFFTRDQRAAISPRYRSRMSKTE